MRKIAIDSDEDDNIPSNFLSIKPTKIEKEPISRKEYPHPQKKNPESEDKKPEKSKPQTPIQDKDKIHAQVKSEKKEKQEKIIEKPKTEKLEKKEKDLKSEKKDNKDNQEKNEKNEKPKSKDNAKEKKRSPKKSPPPKKVLKKEEVDSDASLFDPESSESEKLKKEKSIFNFISITQKIYRNLYFILYGSFYLKKKKFRGIYCFLLVLIFFFFKYFYV